MVGWRHAILLALVFAFAGAQGAGAAVLVIDGAGDGHGVGMSQDGAEGLAQHGYSARQILTHYYTGTTVERVAPEHSIAILLQSRLRSVVFSDATAAGTRALRADHTYIATTAPNGEIALESERGRLLSYLPAPLEVTSRVPIRFDGAASSGVIDGRYRGSLRIELAGGRLRVINSLGLEAYLRGVVPAESPSQWRPAELEAQAIAARSYVVASQPHAGFDLYADTRSQEYGGYGAEAPSTSAAVEATVRDVVTYEGRPIVAYYFASSGGATEDVQNGFPGAAPEPYLVGVLDPFDAGRFGPVTISIHTADRRLRGIVQGTLRSILVTRRGVSPRVVSAQVVGSAGTTSVSGVTLANALGLQSTWDCFSVSASSATLASGWDRACERPSRLGSGSSSAPTGPSGPTGPTGSTVGGAVAGTGASGSTKPSGSTGTSGSGAAAGSAVSNAGGAVGPRA
jgi:stage II sporulation protein D